MAGEDSEEFESIELMSSIDLGGVGNDIILDGEFIECEWPSLEVAGDELL
jgi:hypothetical protein